LRLGEPVEVTPDLAGQTVLSLLRRLCPGESWSKLTGVLQRGLVTVNRVACLDGARRLQSGDVLTRHEHPPAPPPQSTDAGIEFLDSQVVVVQKPAGMMTERRPEERDWPDRRKALQPTLEEVVGLLLAERGPRDKARRPRPLPLRCVHRLDRDTSGLLVFARTADAEASLVDQFRRHAVHRVYWAIVHGRPADQTIVSNLVRDRGDGRRGSVNNPKIGQRAVTHIRCLEVIGDYSLVECRLETGRTNQIRIHMAEAGHLVCGDTKYDQPLQQQRVEDPSGAPRLALHAAELGFLHPLSGVELRFQMPFPRDLEQFVKRLRQQATRLS